MRTIDVNVYQPKEDIAADVQWHVDEDIPLSDEDRTVIDDAVKAFSAEKLDLLKTGEILAIQVELS